MNSEQSSYRRILASTSIIGGATVVTILVGLVRTKIFALVAGPEGIGIIGLLVNVSGLATTLAGLGLAFAGVRAIAASETLERKAEVRRAMLLASWPLALAGGLALWLLREPATVLATGERTHSLLIGLSGAAVALGLFAGIQQGVLQGLQRVTALGVIKVAGALLAALISVPAVVWLGDVGLVIAVVAVPLATVLVARVYAPRDLPPPPPLDPSALPGEWRALLRIGALTTVTGAVQLLGMATVRAIVIQEGSLEASGLFQAVVAITSMNIALVLGAMAADYYPRLSAHAHNRREINRIANQQLHSALLLGTPLLLALVAGAPLVLTLLYTSEFVAAEGMLRLQLTGDLLKIPGWALGFVLLARGDRRAYLLVELLFTLTYVAATVLLIPSLGLEGAGAAYVLAYCLYTGSLLIVCRSQHGIRLTADNLRLMGIAVPLLLFLTLLGKRSELLVFGIGALLAAGAALYAVRELGSRSGMHFRPWGKTE